MKASVKYERDMWVVQLHERNIAAQGAYLDDALRALSDCIAGHRMLGDFGLLPVTPADVIAEFGGEVVDL